MKKLTLSFIALSLVLLGTIPLSSCSSNKMKVALLVDADTLSDHSYQQGTYLAFKTYLDNKGYKENVDYKAFLNKENDKDLMNMVKDAISWGASGVILNGYQFMDVAYEVQSLYPNVKFMIHDSEPIKDDKTLYKDNMLGITYKEHELGYLTGYITALDGYKSFGYMGGVKDDLAVVKFGVGYVAGIHQAMKDLNQELKITDYKYIGSYELNKGAKEIAKSMYQNDAEVIFGACGYAIEDVISEAEKVNKMVIAPDIDQSYLSASVLTSALKIFDSAMKTYFDRLFNNWTGGEMISLGLKDQAVGLPTSDASWRFKNVTINQYKSLYNEILLKADTIPYDYPTLNSFVTGLGQEMQVSENDILGE